MSRQERDPMEHMGRTVTNEPEMITRPGTASTTTTTTHESMAGPVTWEEMRALLRREPTVYERTWRPTAGGLLAILAGAWNFLLGLGALLGATVFTDLLPTFLADAAVAGTGGGIFFLVIGLISIIGGAMALSRRGWPMALAGSIAAVIPSPLILPFILGFFSLIFNVLGHKEFWGPKEFQKDYESNIQHQMEKAGRRQ